MAANEIKERLAAACWVQCGGGDAEAINALSNSRIRFRSLVGFQQRIITTTDPNALPVLILPLDRPLIRSECAVYASRIGTAGPAFNNVNRAVYPNLGAPVADVPQVFVQPILLEWLGPDLDDPQFFPFGITNGVIPLAPPVGANLDLFDAIAVLLPVPIANASSGDFCVLVLKHPPLEGVTAIDDLLPTPETPDPFPLLRAWFRGDTFNSFELGFELVGRVGTEGVLATGEGTNDPAPDPLLNNQDTVETGNSLFTSSMPAAFWDFLGESPWTFYGVAYPTVDNESETLFACGPVTLVMLPSSTDGELSFNGWGGVQLEYPDSDIGVGQWTKIVVDFDTITQRLVNTAAGPAQNILGLPPGAPGVTLTVRGSGGAGEIAFAELLFWDFALSPAQQAIVEAYLTARYATPLPPADPILALEPRAWFRGDTFTQAGGFTTALVGRVGTEGNLVPQLLTYAPPSAQAAANNQLGLLYGDQADNDLISTMPAAFWNFLQTENSFFAAVLLMPGAGIQRVFGTSADDVAFLVDTVTENATWTWGAAGVNALFSLGYPAAQIGVKQYYTSRQNALDAQPITIDWFPAAGQNGGSFLVAPPGTVAAPLRLGNTAASAQLGQVVLLDLIFFDRALSNGEVAVWDVYVTERYGAF